MKEKEVLSLTNDSLDTFFHFIIVHLSILKIEIKQPSSEQPNLQNSEIIANTSYDFFFFFFTSKNEQKNRNWVNKLQNDIRYI